MEMAGWLEREEKREWMDDAFRLKCEFSSLPACVCVVRGAGNLYVWKRLDGDIFLMLRSNRIHVVMYNPKVSMFYYESFSFIFPDLDFIMQRM